MSFALSAVIATIVATSLTVASFAQNPTDPPQSQHRILTVLGRGVQIYTCQQFNGTPQWIFRAPEAILYSADNTQAGIHSAGPVWIYKDGSSIKGEVAQKSPSPEPGAVPWLLLKAMSPDGGGILSKVDFIRRSDTHGGTVPMTECDVQHLNTTSRIPYAATYTFYSAKP